MLWHCTFYVVDCNTVFTYYKRWFKTDYQTESTPETQQSYWQPKQIQLLDIALSIAIAVALVAISFKLSEIIQHVIPQSNVLLTILVSFFGDQYLLLTTLTLLAVAIWGDFFDKLAGSSEMEHLLFTYSL